MFYRIGIVVHPSVSEPKIETIVKPKKAAFKWPWRINMLAIPKRKESKYVPPVGPIYKTFGELEPGVAFRSDQLSRAPLRLLYVNKRLYADRGPKFVKKITKNLDNTWNSIYNYYRKRLREKQLKKLKRKMAKLKAKKLKGKDLAQLEKEKQEFYSRLAIPKKIPEPEKIVRKRVALDDILVNIDKLSTPKEYVIVKPREIGKVRSAALTYEITDKILKLYTSAPERLKKRRSDPIMPGTVSKAALRYKCTPTIEKLAIPSFSAREAKKNEEDKYDPWIISPKALKYKPTPRMLELAKPSERD